MHHGLSIQAKEVRAAAQHEMRTSSRFRLAPCRRRPRLRQHPLTLHPRLLERAGRLGRFALETGCLPRDPQQLLPPTYETNTELLVLDVALLLFRAGEFDISLKRRELLLAHSYVLGHSVQTGRHAVHLRLELGPSSPRVLQDIAFLPSIGKLRLQRTYPRIPLPRLNVPPLPLPSHILQLLLEPRRFSGIRGPVPLIFGGVPL
mmetsp:Transcript_31616/g.76528  ORF Transcript_31616/g.76528 Transcript_31616/m.76528 type:complete len:204 (-) Transcript_31616:720-1331(-)